MGNFIFLFDLDSTITKQEIFPTIFKELGMSEEMSALEGNAVNGEMPFKKSFLKKIEILKKVPVSEICRMIGEIELKSQLVDFIKKYQRRCYIVTGHLDVWIRLLIEKLGMEQHVFCSRASVENDFIENVVSVVDKNAVISQMALPFVAVGDGNNDAEMMEAAEIGIGYGGVRDIAPSVLDCASHAVYREDKLVEFLERLVS